GALRGHRPRHASKPIPGVETHVAEPPRFAPVVEYGPSYHSSARAPLAGRRRRGGAVVPGAIRRAVIRKPVCPTIRCSGRTPSPSTCHPRTTDSQDVGSVNPAWARTDSTILDSCVVVAT